MHVFGWKQTATKKPSALFVKTIILPIRMKSIRYSSKSATISKVSAVISMRCRCAYKKICSWITVRCTPSMRSSVHTVLQSHLSDELIQYKIAFIIALNFPHLTLEEKEALAPTAKPGPMHVWATCSRTDPCRIVAGRLPMQKAMPTFISPSITYMAM